MSDPRLARLRTLSRIWSVENLLLATSVFNRLFIYVEFNGMTRMRVVGMLGVAAVIGGFLLVLRKIARNHDFIWLIRRQIWTVALAVYAYAVFPVDAIVNQYNVGRILAGDPAPSVQISVHPTTDEGFLCLEPLINCDDTTIREGIRSMLDEKLAELESELKKDSRTISISNSDSIQTSQQHWSEYQIARWQLIEQLRSAKSKWQGDLIDRTASLEKFRAYAFQWY